MILVVGSARFFNAQPIHVKSIPLDPQRGSGKSSLINTVFEVNITVCSFPLRITVTLSDQPDCNLVTRQRQENQTLTTGSTQKMVVMLPSMGPACGPGDGQNLQIIRDFISYRTDPGRSTADNLHAVW